ncbi:MAG: SemiSWEET family transporter, partial [Candidatus Aenigmatarchaeota archaeon]
KMELAQMLGWIATILFSVMIIPQMVKTIKTKDTSGVSLMMFVVYLAANIIALVYAFMIDQSPLIIKYTIAIGTTSIYIGLFFVFYKNKSILSDSVESAIDKNW